MDNSEVSEKPSDFSGYEKLGLGISRPVPQVKLYTPEEVARIIENLYEHIRILYNICTNKS